MDDSEFTVAIMRKMLMHRWIGGKHTALDNIPKGFPNHVRNDVARVTENLIREGFIIRKPTSYGEHVSLDPKRVYEAKKIAGII